VVFLARRPKPHELRNRTELKKLAAHLQLESLEEEVLLGGPALVIRALVTPVLRTTHWIGFVPAGVLAVSMGIVAGQQPAAAEHRYLPTRLAILAIVTAVGFVFDDSATQITDPAPSPLRLRRFIRAVAAFLLASAIFTLMVFFAADDMSLVATVEPNSVDADEADLNSTAQPSAFPWGRLFLEMATMSGFVLAAAAAMNRRDEPEPGRLAIAALYAIYALTWLIPESLKPWAHPTHQRWETGAFWWWGVFAFVWLITAILSWDSRVGWRIPGRGARGSSQSRAGTGFNWRLPIGRE
jgi:hypothetical protein